MPISQKFLWEPTPNKEAADFIADKPVVSKKVFDGLLPELKAKAFTITGVESADVMQNVRDKIATLPEGADWDDVKEDVVKEISPWLVTSDDAEEKADQLLAATRRAELLMRTHGYQAYATAAYRTMWEQRDIFPWWKYQSMEDSHVRATHAALDGHIFPAESEFWLTHFPPWEWGCRCPPPVPMMDEEVQEIKAAEMSLPEAARKVVDGERLAKLLKEKTLAIQNPNPKERDSKPVIDVELSPKSQDFRFNPGMLQMPMAAIKQRYDAETFSTFEEWAKKTKFKGKRTVWDWLNPASPKPKKETAPAPADVAEEKPEPVKPAETKHALPDSPDGLKEVRHLGGSTGADLVQNSAGEQWVRKRGANADHLREEVMADSLYRANGVAVPESRLYETASGPVKLAQFVKGTQLNEYLRTAGAAEKEAALRDIQKGFAVDALLGNWDVAGLNMDNILVDAVGKAWRIDNGGSLRFRAMGTAKGNDWNAFPDELWTLRDSAKNSVTGKIFGGLDIYGIARQIETLTLEGVQMESDLRKTLEARLANLQDVARKALDMEHDAWKASYSDELTRHIIGLRKAGITERLPEKLEQSPGSVMVVDENGKPWDDLRAATTTFGTVAKTTSNALPQDVFYADLVAAAKTLNHHSSNGGFAFNATKVNTALAMKPALEKLALEGKGDVASMAQKYLGDLDDIQKAADAAGAKQVLTVPKIEQYLKKPAKSKATPPAPVGSLVEALAQYIKDQGGDFEAVVRWKASQAGDSWNADAQSYKAFLNDQLDLPEGKIFWKNGIASAQSDLATLKAGMSGSAETAWTAHHAFVQELLANTDLRYNDRAMRLVRLVRTEAKVAMKQSKLKPGDKAVEMKSRGLCESASIFRRTTVYGSEGTVQAVPHSRVTGVYLMERRPGQGGSSFLGDTENEFTFTTSGLTFNYDNAPAFDGSADAKSWGVPLPTRP